MLVFDHGWHQLAIAYWLFGPIRRIFGWIGSTQVAPDIAPEITLDAPSTLVWEHDNGVRGVLDITLAPDTYFRSDYYTCDERVEVTAARGYVRCNRVSACGVQEPSVVVYAEGQTRGYHALPDSRPTRSRRSAEPRRLLHRAEHRSGDGRRRRPGRAQRAADRARLRAGGPSARRAAAEAGRPPARSRSRLRERVRRNRGRSVLWREVRS